MEQGLSEFAAVLAALADPTRLRILALLAAGETCVCDIHESLQVPQPKASRHLAYLRRRGLVRGRRQGLWIYYRLGRPRDPALAVLVEAMIREAGRRPQTRRDAARLQRRTGGGPARSRGGDAVCPSPADAARGRAKTGPACCGPTAGGRDGRG